MNEILDMETIYRQERRRWFKEEAPPRSFRDILTSSVPYSIVLVALVLYGLSAPHTAGVFDKLTPGWGFIAPVGVEFGLLYAAFRRPLAIAHQVIGVGVAANGSSGIALCLSEQPIAVFAVGEAIQVVVSVVNRPIYNGLSHQRSAGAAKKDDQYWLL